MEQRSSGPRPASQHVWKPLPYPESKEPQILQLPTLLEEQFSNFLVLSAFYITIKNPKECLFGALNLSITMT